MDTALAAISDRSRREILRLVWAQELPAGEIARHFTVTRPAISQHLRVLEDAGLVSVRKVGTRRLYRARPQGLAELRTYFESLWDDSLERLKFEAEQEERKEPRHAGNRPQRSD
ncbi:MAG: transcriptional regulator [Anaerolinea sp.]|nr:transcriptional regulator [Anaerolinea sp.]